MSLQAASGAFLEGYRLTRSIGGSRDTPALLDALFGLGHDRAPFAFEGAGMALWIGEERESSASRLAAVVDALPTAWRLFPMLGVGCALVRMARPVPVEPVVLDGYGFQTGLTSGGLLTVPLSASPEFQRGMGRAAWFATGGDARTCTSLLRRAGNSSEHWRGAGTACAFAGDPKGNAADLFRLGAGFETVLRSAAEEALVLWSSLGSQPPARVGEVVEAFARPVARTRPRTG